MNKLTNVDKLHCLHKNILQTVVTICAEKATFLKCTGTKLIDESPCAVRMVKEKHTVYLPISNLIWRFVFCL